MRTMGNLALSTMVVLGVGLTGCGHSQPGRTTGGAAAGAATGGAIGLVGGPIGVVVGALVGGGVGAVTGANTTPKQVDLPNPPWNGQAGAEQQEAGSAPPARDETAAPSRAAEPVTPVKVTPLNQ